MPAAVNDSYTLNEDGSLGIVGPGVLANDTDIELDPLTAVLVDDVSHGTLTLNADGSFDYTPAADWFGEDTFTYKADDGTALSNLATVTITVNSVNDAPVAVNDAYVVNEDAALVVNAAPVLANDTDIEGGTLTAVLVDDVTSGTLTLNANGTFTYVPDANWSGEDRFTYKADDGTALSNLATVTITVNAVNDCAGGCQRLLHAQ